MAELRKKGITFQIIWHWKDPEQHGTYIVPETKRVDCSENKTLIYLLGTVLWECANEADENMVNGYIEEYEKAIK